MNARYYLPGIGRFVSPDTLVPEPAEPQSFSPAYRLHYLPLPCVCDIMNHDTNHDR